MTAAAPPRGSFTLDQLFVDRLLSGDYRHRDGRLQRRRDASGLATTKLTSLDERVDAAGYAYLFPSSFFELPPTPPSSPVSAPLETVPRATAFVGPAAAASEMSPTALAQRNTLIEYVDVEGMREARAQIEASIASGDVLTAREQRRRDHFLQVIDAFDRELLPFDEANANCHLLGLRVRSMLCAYNDRDGGGRLYPHSKGAVVDHSKLIPETRSICFQSANRELRPFLCGRFGRDFDLVNCHPEILRQIASQLEWEDGREAPTLTELDFYCDDRPAFIDHVADVHKLRSDQEAGIADYRKDRAKMLVMRLIFGGAYDAWLADVCAAYGRSASHEPRSPRIKALAAQLAELRRAVFESTRFRQFVQFDRARLRARGDKLTDRAIDRSVFARVAQKIENDVLDVIRDSLHDSGWLVLSLCFDGVLVLHQPGRMVDPSQIEAKIFESTALRMRLVEKPFFLENGSFPTLTYKRA